MSSMGNGRSRPRPKTEAGLVEALTAVYSALIKRQRTASAAFVRWSSPHRRAHEFAWLDKGEEVLIRARREVRITSSSPIYDSINKMMATIELNPYERELQYGYPYLIGYLDGKAIRAPVLTIPISIFAQGGVLLIQPDEEVVRFNSLPFRSEFDSAAHELALSRLIDATPEYPVQEESLRGFCDSIVRETKVENRARLDGLIDPAPTQPRSGSFLAIVDNAACFVAPKTSYFLASDLDYIGKDGRQMVEDTALGWLVGKRDEERTSDIFADSRRVFFPFSSNQSQRRVALLVNDTDNRIIVVQGPPGTGKSLTIANVACHLVASGRRVLITSQKDQALHIVDDLLRGVGLPQLPMTLLRQDKDSRRELRERLDSIQKTRSAVETESNATRQAALYDSLVRETAEADGQLAQALLHEHLVAAADSRVNDASSQLRRLGARLHSWRVRRRAARQAPKSTDVLGEITASRREKMLGEAAQLLKTAAEWRIGEATRNERNQLREFSKLLGRSQTSHKNFSVFDRMKSQPDRCEMLLKTLPCWIMTPDDVARLFPCKPGLFDVVIIDEASQCDLPSMTPVLYRATQAIIAGDSKQMQAQRFAFTSSQVAGQAWEERGLSKFDPDRWLDPTRIDLLQLASIRMDEEVFLDEHYRSLPPIIAFSNQRWYGKRLRIMRDPADRRFGDQPSPVVCVHHISDGHVNPGTQENEREARELVKYLKEQLRHPGYGDASFGVLCLFDEQMHLISDLVAEEIDEEDRLTHDLVVVNPDGFQGDERDVIYYSLSYDADGMSQAALSARQAEREHIQGMLNVAFTRARDEMHVFHSAPIEKFGMASGRGAIREWLEHCAAVATARASVDSGNLTRAHSEFEAQVIQGLEAHGVKVIPQYPSCGFSIDLVAELDGRRVAVECDGEAWHLDEHGNLRIEDVQRQEILERAGWDVVRIPYRGWLADSDKQIDRVIAAIKVSGEEEVDEGDPDKPPEAGGNTSKELLRLSYYESAIVQTMKGGARDRESVLRGARVYLNRSRLGSRIRWSLEQAIAALERRRVVLIEDGELFLSEEARNATIPPYVGYTPLPGRRRARRVRRAYGRR